MSALSKKVQKEIREDMELKVARVTSGGCRDYADYKACCAELVGMHNATQLFLDIEKQYNTEGDEE